MSEKFAECEDCGELVEAEVTHNGVTYVGHYVHCGWGHQCSVDDLVKRRVLAHLTGEKKDE